MISFDGAFGSDIVQMIIHAGPVVKGVLFLLLVFSVVSWAIIFMKWRLYRRAREENGYFLEMFWDNPAFHRLYNDSNDLTASPVAQLFRAGYTEIQRLGKIQNPSGTKNGAPMLSIMDVVERTLKKTMIDQGNRMEKAISFLATTATRLRSSDSSDRVGIMEAFRALE